MLPLLEGYKMNTYTIDTEHCPECDEVELVYLQSCGGIHCQNCGTWFDTNGNILDDESEKTQ
jgi:ribosomal protein S27E